MQCIQKISALVMLVICLSACTKKSDQPSPLTYLENKYQVSISPNVKRIYIIDENKVSCGNCLRHFHDYLVKKKPTVEELVLLNNTGTFINRNFFAEKQCTIIQFKPKKSSNDSLVPHLGIIYLTKGVIDSIINVTPENIQKILLQDEKESKIGV